MLPAPSTPATVPFNTPRQRRLLGAATQSSVPSGGPLASGIAPSGGRLRRETNCVIRISELSVSPRQGPQTFTHRFGEDPDRERRAADLLRRASAPLPVLGIHPASARPVTAAPRPTEPIDVGQLMDTYERLIPAACLADQERSLSTMETLVEARVHPHELLALDARARSRDACRALFAAELTFGLSFGAAGAAALGLAAHPLIEPDSACPSGADLVAGLNAGGSFMLGSGIIAAGAEAADAMIRVGQMGPRYNEVVAHDAGARTPFGATADGKTIQRDSAWPFGLLYGFDHVARARFSTPAGLRMLAGAGAAALSALYKWYGASWKGGQLDPVWLDASTPDKRSAMQSAITALRQDFGQASRGYLSDHFLPGLRASLGQVVSEKGMVRMGARFVAASVARAGSALAAATGTASNLYVQLTSEGLLALTWGTLSTWPLRLLDGAALGRTQERGAPVVARTPAQAVAPPPKTPASLVLR